MRGKMVDDSVERVTVSSMSDDELQSFLKKEGISLKLNEVKKIVELIGRGPTLTELHIFNIQWSEHSSYKSSGKLLKLLPTKGSTVILPPGEDAGIIRLGKNYGIVISHESHNHPSQVVPYEGAATGIGGNIRDVLCMGGKVLACADPLRFGNASGKHSARTKYIANAVVDGIAGYGNPLGIPVIAGDIYFNESFDDNCLVNVVTMGVIEEKNIVHSRVPEKGEGYDVIVIGKPTDNSGFGGAAFASLILDEEDQESNKGAVQVPDPFLKNMLLRATYSVFEQARKQGIELGFKDCGAGGYMCAASEMGSEANLGMDVDLDEVHVSMKNLAPYIIACSETQERFVFVVPSSFTPTVLKTYNEDFALPNIADGAQAKVVGKVLKEPQFVLRHNGKIVCDLPIKVVTKGISYDREVKEPKREFSEPQLDEPEDYNPVLLDVLRLPQIASKSSVYEHYDTNVLGNTIIRPGEADAGVIQPLQGESYGVALSVDSNPKYARINPFLGAVNAVAECMRNVAAVGAKPIGMTDCLNYGNPEIPEQFWEFSEGVKGLVEAATELKVKDTDDPVPFVSGNVSFYNESAAGKSIDPSAIVSCVGVLDDYSKAIMTKLKKVGSGLYLIGPRKDELGGSAYYEVRGELGANVPKIDYEQERGMIYGVIDAIDKRLVLSCHDISDGGVITAVAEMILGQDGKGKIGAELLFNDELRTDVVLFSESSGFVMEIADDKLPEVEKIFVQNNIDVFKLGETVETPLLKVTHKDKEMINLNNEQLADAWCNGLPEAMK